MIEGIGNETPTSVQDNGSAPLDPAEHYQDNRPLYTKIVRNELDQITRAIGAAITGPMRPN
jgi:hypothetical protein